MRMAWADAVGGGERVIKVRRERRKVVSIVGWLIGVVFGLFFRRLID